MFSSTKCITLLAVFVTESLIIVSVNLLTIIVFIKNRNLRTRAMYLVISLTVADMLVGLLSQSPSPLVFMQDTCDLLRRVPLDGKIETLFSITMPFLPLVSLTNIAVISLERTHAAFRPFKHRVIKKWVYGVIIATVWVLPVMILSAAMFISFYDLTDNLFILWPIYYCFCLFVICVSYACISIKFVCGAYPQHHGAVNRQRKLTVTLLIMTIVSLILLIPFLLYIFVVAIGSKNILSSLSYLCFSFILAGVNSFVNPILYSVRIPEIKQAFISLFSRQRNENVVILV
ncbi:unnamed protein product [Porites lobata]|uniref:G-protein coupled receptors family 1 profile domain-containing protein n=1 Tax=Porites lobata TaxID=104759 RepID=A0ABN8R070_9CNID|nr:unnamed protein product [Porites lobata]